jgi:hypothetical protein
MLLVNVLAQTLPKRNCSEEPACCLAEQRNPSDRANRLERGVQINSFDMWQQLGDDYKIVSFALRSDIKGGSSKGQRGFSPKFVTFQGVIMKRKFNIKVR